MPSRSFEQNYGVVSRHNLMKKYNITERTAYRDLNMLSPFIEACGNGKYHEISQFTDQMVMNLADWETLPYD
ncbi:hypothetical protein O5269_26510, partial [Escherichia coli]|nr:hypothetical protein [Escherichia coli]